MKEADEEELSLVCKGSTTSSPASLWRDLLVPQEVRESRKATELKHIQDFIAFIKSYTYPGHQFPTFKHQVLDLARGATKLEVRFNYLLDGLRQDKKLLDLCLHLGNSDSHSWLSVSKGALLNTEWVQDQSTLNLSNMSTLVHIEFLNKPFRMVQFKDLLRDKLRPAARNVSLMSATRSAYASTSSGRLIFKAAVLSLVSKFRQDMWYEEEFDIDEFFLMNMESCYICKTPVNLSSLDYLPRDAAKKKMAEGKASNLNSLWNMFERDYTSADGKRLPMYFGILKQDLTSASTGIVSEEWFLKYLEKNFCWASSMCRKTFTCEFQLITKSFDLKTNAKMKFMLSEIPPDSDWRLSVRHSGDNLLNSVFWYGIDLEEQGLQSFRGNIGCCEWLEIPQFAYERVRYNTIGAVIEYKRNLMEHLCDHLRRQAEAAKKEKSYEIKITDFDEIELFASSSQPPVEQRALKFLMEKSPAEFESLL